MHTKIVTIVFAVLLVAAAWCLWVFGAGELFSQVATMNLKDVPTANIVLAGCVPVVALLGLLSRWNDSKKNHHE